MKKTILTLACVAASVAAFAQGKITVATDVNTSLVTFTTDTTRMLANDVALAGHAVPVILGAGQKPLVFGLYAGTSSTSLSLETAIAINTAAGTGQQDGSITPTHFTLPWTGLTYMEVKVWDSAYATYEAQAASGVRDYLGTGSLFSMTPGTSIAYPNIYNGGGTTWSPAPIIIAAAPEPSTFALAGLGAAALMIFRRRK